MLRYLLRRLVILLLSLLIAAVVLFVLLRLLPGDPAAALVGVGATPEQIEAARAQIGSDQPLGAQFVTYLGDLARFDLGQSFVSRASVLEEISRRLSVTLPLTLAAFVLALVIGVPLGVLAAVKADRWIGLVLSVVSQIGIAVPVFWLGILLVYQFSLTLRWLPSGGFPLRGYAQPLQAIESMVLPVLTIAIIMSASLMRYVRASMLEVLNSDFLRTARALGESHNGALVRHGLRNAAVPALNVLALMFIAMLGGAVAVEQVFTIPGLGKLTVSSTLASDVPVIMGIVIVTVILVVVVNLLIDLLQAWLNPKVRLS